MTDRHIAEQTQSGKSWQDLPYKKGPRPNYHAKSDLGKYIKKRLNRGFTIKGFVEESRSHRGAECLFVPGATKNRPAKVTYLGKMMTASRYMTLLIYGTPKYEGAVSRHLCGNGHLSCINPDHLVWGSTGDNIADMVKHRKAETVQERITSIYGKL